MRLEFIKKYVEQESGLEDISINDRSGRYPLARTLYAVLAREYTNESFNTIGKLIKRDHSSVLIMVRRNRFRIFDDPLLSDVYRRFKKGYRHVLTETAITDETVELVDSLTQALEENKLMRSKLVEIALDRKRVNDFKDRLANLTEGFSDRQLFELETRLEPQINMIKTWKK